MEDITRAAPASMRAKYFTDGGIEGPTFINEAGIEIVTKRFLPEEKVEKVPKSLPQALIFFIHGYGVHCHVPCTTRFGNACAKHGFAMFALDLPGHGLSGGIRLDVIPEIALKTVEQYIELVKKEFPGIPYFICGESLGGLYAVKLSLAHSPNEEFLGTFLAAPAVQNDLKPSTFLVWIIRNFVVPNWPLHHVPPFIAPVLQPEDVTNSKQLQEEIAEDEIIVSKTFRVRSGDLILQLAQEMQSKVEEVTFPFLIVHGDDDKVVPIEGSKFLCEKSKTPPEKKKLLIIRGGGHAALGESEETENYEAIFEWFQQAVDKSWKIDDFIMSKILETGTDESVLERGYRTALLFVSQD
jgi:acylglycerol lipase